MRACFKFYAYVDRPSSVMNEAVILRFRGVPSWWQNSGSEHSLTDRLVAMSPPLRLGLGTAEVPSQCGHSDVN